MKLIRIVIACAFIGHVLNATEDATTIATKQLFEAIEKKSLDGVKAAITKGADVNKFMPVTIGDVIINRTSLGYAERLNNWKKEEADIVKYLVERGAKINSCSLMSDGAILPCDLGFFATPYLLDIFEREIPNMSIEDLRVVLRSALSHSFIFPIQSKYTQPETKELIQKITPIALKLIEQGIGDLDPSNNYNNTGFLPVVSNSPILIKALLNRGTKAINEKALGYALNNTRDPESLQLLLDQTKNIPLSTDLQSIVVANKLDQLNPELLEKVLKHGMRPSKEHLTDYIFNVLYSINTIKTTEKLSVDEAKRLSNTKTIIQLLAQYIDPTVKYSKMIDGKMLEKSLNDVLQEIEAKEKELA